MELPGIGISASEIIRSGMNLGKIRLPSLILLLLLGGSLGILAISLVEESSRYATLEEVRQAKGKVMHVIGALCESEKYRYQPIQNPNYMEFCLVDRTGKKAWIVYFGAPPQDFAFVEEVAVNVRWDETQNRYVAERILLKCPSKYVEEQALTQGK